MRRPSNEPHRPNRREPGIVLTFTVTAAHHDAQLLLQGARLQVDRLLFAFERLQLALDVRQLLQLGVAY